MTKRKEQTMQEDQINSTSTQLDPKEVTMQNIYQNLPPMKFSQDDQGMLTGFIHVGKFGEGKPVTQIEDWGAIKSGMNTLLWSSVGAYVVFEPGLYLRIDPATRYAVGFKPRVGYVKCNYNGQYLQDLHHVLPPTGWEGLGLRGGEFVGEMHAMPMPYIPGEEMNDFDKHRNNAFNAYSMLDKFATGANVAMRYNVRNEWQMRQVIEFIELCQLDPINRKVALELRSARQRDTFTEKKVTDISNKPEFTGFYTKIEEVRTHDGSKIPATELLGKRVQRYLQACPINAPVLITESNFAVQMEVIRRNMLNVEILG